MSTILTGPSGYCAMCNSYFAGLLSDHTKECAGILLTGGAVAAPSVVNKPRSRDEGMYQLRCELETWKSLAKRANEELRLIRMKDCGAVYDVLLRTDLHQAIFPPEEPSK